MGHITQAVRSGMEQKQHEWMQAVTEALSDLLAARVAQATLLEAMMVSHPDPVMLRKAWDELSSQRIAYVAQKKRWPPIHGRWMPTRSSSSRPGKKNSAATFRVRRMRGARMRKPVGQLSIRATQWRWAGRVWPLCMTLAQAGASDCGGSRSWLPGLRSVGADVVFGDQRSRCSC